MNPIHTLLFKTHFNIIFYPFTYLMFGLFSGRPTKMFYASHISVAYACKICSSSVGTFHLPRLTLSLLGLRSFVSIPLVKRCLYKQKCYQIWKHFTLVSHFYYSYQIYGFSILIYSVKEVFLVVSQR
jgi:hypothetical protein